MNKITKNELLEYISEVGEFSKERRKYSSFWCTVTHTIEEEDVKSLAEEGINASDFLGVRITRNGLWDDGYGTDWHDTTYEKVEEYQELVPEVVIPTHYVTKVKTKAFEPVFEE